MSFITDLINKITNFRVKVGDKLNTLKNQIGQLNSLTTNDKTSLVGAINEVNNIQIGGRNLLLQTTISEINLVGGVDIYAEKAYKISNLEKNTEYIFSVIAKGDEMTLISFIPNVIVDYKSLTTEFKLYTWKFSTSNEPAILDFLIRAQAGKNITITKAKLEKGNKSTDWTPAPEDQVSDWNETDSTKFSFIKNKPTIPTVNNGQLTLSTGTGLNGSTNFTANQSSNSIFDVSIASTHKLPSTAEWDDTLKKDGSNIVTENFSIERNYSNGDTFSMDVRANPSGYGEMSIGVSDDNVEGVRFLFSRDNIKMRSVDGEIESMVMDGDKITFAQYSPNKVSNDVPQMQDLENLKQWVVDNYMSKTHPSNGITSNDISNWNTSYSWGNHSGKYLSLNGGTVNGDIFANKFEEN